MARTKQTSKKSTGGTANRKLFIPAAQVLRSHVSHPPQATPDVEMGELNTSVSTNLLPVAASTADAVAGTKVDNASNLKADDVSYHLQAL